MALAKQVLVRNTFMFRRSFSSALYITGDKAHNTFAVVTPVLEFEQRLTNKSELERNLQLRRVEIDLAKVQRRWNFYKHLDEQKLVLEATRAELGKEISHLMKVEPKNETNIQQFRMHAKLVREELRVLRDYLYGVEETAALNVLALPNDLHEKTPPDSELVIHTFLEKPETKSRCHLEIGAGSNVIEHTDPLFYFLKGDAALFELTLVDYMSNALLDASFTQFSNADFCRSIVAEGCSTDFLDKLQVFTLEEIHSDAHHEFSRLHLTGGASLYSFMAYFTRHAVQASYFPLKYFASGRRYQPTDSGQHGLFGVGQETAVEVFMATEEDDEVLEDLVARVVQIYEPLGLHFRLAYLPANKLKNYESLRLSVQMFSCYLQEYVEVGHVSLCDNFLSKRLLFTYSVNKVWRYPKVIAGSLVRVQPLLACMLEYNDVNSNKDLFPDVLKNYVLL